MNGNIASTILTIIHFEVTELKQPFRLFSLALEYTFVLNVFKIFRN